MRKEPLRKRNFGGYQGHTPRKPQKEVHHENQKVKGERGCDTRYHHWLHVQRVD
jgi:hypothetical protein